MLFFFLFIGLLGALCNLFREVSTPSGYVMRYEGSSNVYASQKRGSSAYETVKECFQAKDLKGF